MVREKLSGFRGMPLSRAMDLMATLPWTSLLALAQSPRTPPMIRRHAEKKLVHQIPRMTLGEKIAFARRIHRTLVKSLLPLAEGRVLTALLDNPRLVENDVLVMVHTHHAPAEFYAEIARHRRWGLYYGVRRALAESPRTPLPIALSALVQLPGRDLRELMRRRDVPQAVRQAAEALDGKDERKSRG